VWNGWDLFAEYEYQSSTPIRQTIHGAPGDLVTQTKTGFTTTYYYPDGLGSTVYLASGVGALLEQYTYDAYGTPTIYNASGAQIGVSAYAADHFFTGRQWHPALGLYDLRNRFYLPEWGRFLQPDPIGFAGDSANLYRYCANNPVNLADPSGLGNKLDGGGENIPEMPPIHVTATYIDSGLNDPAVWVGNHGTCVDGGGGGGGGGDKGGNNGENGKIDDKGRKKDPCAHVPKAPPGVSVNKNIAQAKAHNDGLGLDSMLWFYGQVRNKGPWDYKQLGRQYRDFGNFNFGATGSAVGFDALSLLRAAGWAQIQAGTSRPQWGDPGMLLDPSSGRAPYGDDPRDQELIKDGIAYYEAGCD
jgi:RHS repeat-associated protein